MGSAIAKVNAPVTPLKLNFFSELPDEKRPRYKASIEKITDRQDLLDLAVLKVEGIPDDIEPLKTQSGRIQRNLDITIIGHPYTVKNPWVVVKGKVINYSPNDPLIPLDVNVAPGNSGGPVLNSEGLVVAMVIRNRASSDIAVDPNIETPIVLEDSPATSGVGLAYRIDVVIKKLQEWGF